MPIHPHPPNLFFVDPLFKCIHNTDILGRDVLLPKKKRDFNRALFIYAFFYFKIHPLPHHIQKANHYVFSSWLVDSETIFHLPTSDDFKIPPPPPEVKVKSICLIPKDNKKWASRIGWIKGSQVDCFDPFHLSKHRRIHGDTRVIWK